MRITMYDGIRFIEGMPDGATVLGDACVSIGGIFQSSQLKNLDDVKALMVSRVRQAGGNAVANFKYGQKSVGFLSSLLQRDDVAWYGSGKIVLLK